MSHGRVMMMIVMVAMIMMILMIKRCTVISSTDYIG